MNILDESMPRDLAYALKRSGEFSKSSINHTNLRTKDIDYEHSVYTKLTPKKAENYIYKLFFDEVENGVAPDDICDLIINPRVAIILNGQIVKVCSRPEFLCGADYAGFGIEVNDDQAYTDPESGEVIYNTAEIILPHILKIADAIYKITPAIAPRKDSAFDYDPESPYAPEDHDERWEGDYYSGRAGTFNSSAYRQALDLPDEFLYATSLEDAYLNKERLENRLQSLINNNLDVSDSYKDYLIKDYKDAINKANSIIKDFKAERRYRNSTKTLQLPLIKIKSAIQKDSEATEALQADLDSINRVIINNDLDDRLPSKTADKIKANIQSMIEEYEEQVRLLQNKLEQAKLELEELEAEDPEKGMWDINEPILIFQKELDAAVNNTNKRVQDFKKQIVNMLRPSTNINANEEVE